MSRSDTLDDLVDMIEPAYETVVLGRLSPKVRLGHIAASIVLYTLWFYRCLRRDQGRTDWADPSEEEWDDSFLTSIEAVPGLKGRLYAVIYPAMHGKGGALNRSNARSAAWQERKAVDRICQTLMIASPDSQEQTLALYRALEEALADLVDGRYDEGRPRCEPDVLPGEHGVKRAPGGQPPRL